MSFMILGRNLNDINFFNFYLKHSFITKPLFFKTFRKTFTKLVQYYISFLHLLHQYIIKLITMQYNFLVQG